VVRTELVSINITALPEEEVEKLLNIKIPGCSLEIFGAGGYFITGTTEQIEKAKEVLNSLSTDFMEDTRVLKLSPGIVAGTVSDVLALYYKQENSHELLELGNSRILIKSQKEKLEQMIKVLVSYGLVEELNPPDPEEKIETRMISLSSDFPAEPLTVLLDSKSPNSLVSKYPSVQFDDSFKPLLIITGKTQDLSAIEAYLADLEKIWRGSYVETVIVSDKLMAKEAEKFIQPKVTEYKTTGEALTSKGDESISLGTPSLFRSGLEFQTAQGTESTTTGISSRSVEYTDYLMMTNSLLDGEGDVSQYLKKRWLGLEVSVIYYINAFVIKGENPQIVNQAASELKKIDSDLNKEIPVKPSITPIVDKKGHFDLEAEERNILSLVHEIADLADPKINIFVPDENATHTCTLSLKDLTWEKWINIIERLYDYNVELVEGLAEPIYIVTPPTIDHSTGLKKNRVLNISHGFEEVKSLISSQMFGGQVYTDEVNGVVIFTNISDSKMTQLKPMIAKIVQPKKMVEIQALVIDSRYLDKLEKNMQMTLSASPTMVLSPDGFSFTGNLLDLANSAKLLTALTKDLSVDMDFKMTKTDTEGDYFLNPKITTSSGKTATIQIGQTLTVITDSGTGTTTTNINSGYWLQVTPTVRTDGTVYLVVDVRDGTAEEKGTSVSFVVIEDRSTKANTEVVLKNGETLLIGGLKYEGKSKNITKIPFFGDLPFIGQFFRKESENVNNQTIDILITPTVIEVNVSQDNVFGLNT
nr:hypothetical protein [Thermotogota bacterium]